MRATVGGTTWRYIYNGDRVMEETNDSGGVLARHTTASGSYYQPWLHMQRSGGLSRFPLQDGVGTARRLVDAAGTATDAYSLDAFGRYMGGWGNPTQNPYRFGAAWGYLTDTPGSGLLQLGARYYWPEVGRFLQQDPVGDGMNWYLYAVANPVSFIDPEGLDVVLSIGGQPWLAFDAGSVDQLGMSAGATLTGLATGLTGGVAGALGFDLTDPCDPYANLSKGMATFAGALLGAALVGPEQANFPKNAGGIEASWGKNLRIGWHRFMPKKGRWAARQLNRLHYHRRGPGGIRMHRPWEGRW